MINYMCNQRYKETEYVIGFLILSDVYIQGKHTHTHTHTHIYIYIYKREVTLIETLRPIRPIRTNDTNEILTILRYILTLPLKLEHRY